MGTFRTILTVSGKKYYAAGVGFVEVFLWFVVVREALNTDEKSILVAFAYAGGYAMGTFLGSILAKLLIKTKESVQVITSKKDEKMLEVLREKGFAVTVLNASGSDKTVDRYLLFIEIDGSKLKTLKKLITSLDEGAFITITEVKQSINGYFSKNKNKHK